MKLFGERGVTPGTIGHYVRTDGKGGYLLMELTDEGQNTQAFENVLAYEQYLEFEYIPVATIEEALPSIIKMVS